MATQIRERQIADGAITNAKIAAGAAIATTKLADGVNFILRGGTVPFTASQSMGGFNLTNVATGTQNDHAVNLGQLNTALSNQVQMFKAKPSARAATTANINIANPGTAVFDGVTLTNGQILFVGQQTTAAQNGLYTFNGSGAALTRIVEMDVWTEIPGAFFAVEEGTTLGDTLWLVTANQGGTLGTTAITAQQIPSTAGLLNSNFVDRETPSGLVNGSNVTYTLANTPVAGSERVFLNGQLITPGGEDYTISGGTITMAVAPTTGEIIRVWYRK